MPYEHEHTILCGGTILSINDHYDLAEIIYDMMLYNLRVYLKTIDHAVWI